MIDTDKYEGHTPAPWRAVARNIHAEADWSSGIGDIIYASKRHGNGANARLIADAPDLLAEVKRLREQVKDLEYEVEHWKWELQTRMCPIEFDALVNGDEEE